MKKVTIPTIENEKSKTLSQNEIVVVSIGKELTVKDLAKEWSSFDPRVPLAYLLASKRAARLKNAF